MRMRYDRDLTYDLFDDQWRWLLSTEPLEEEIPPWTEDEIIKLYERLLELSVLTLFDKRLSAATSLEINRWMMNYKDPNPFSFKNCCVVCGLDPDEFREGVLTRLSLARRRLH